MTANKLYRRALAKNARVSLREADNLIMDQSRKVAELAGVSCGGHSERQGVVFNTGMNTGVGSALLVHATFDYEIVFGSPEIVIEWARYKHEQMVRRAV